MKRITFFTVILVIISLLLPACSAKTADNNSTPVPQQTNLLIVEGRLLPAKTIEQFFNVSGQIAEVLVTDGETVTKDQELVRLNNSSEANLALARAQQELLAAQQGMDTLNSQADLSLAQAELSLIDAQDSQKSAQIRYDANASKENKAELDLATANLKLVEDKYAKLTDNEGVDPDLMANAEARLTAAQAAVENAQAALNSLTLKAGMDGTIIDLNLLPGQQVNAGVPVLTLADMTTWIVKTENLTEQDVASITLGEKVEVVLDALPNGILEGEVTHINTRFEEQRGDITYTVTILLTKTDPQMRWGMTGAVRFIR
jgi:multidrug resistance efflux pump